MDMGFQVSSARAGRKVQFRLHSGRDVSCFRRLTRLNRGRNLSRRPSVEKTPPDASVHTSHTVCSTNVRTSRRVPLD